MTIRTRAAALCALALGLLAAGPALAQDRMAEGTWTGTVFPPDGDVVDLEYVVAYADDALGIDLVPPPELGATSVPATQVLHEEGTLSFTLDVGVIVVCTLYLEEDGHYEGECIDDAGDGALMTMFPPEGG